MSLPTLQVVADGFGEGQPIPRRFTCDGSNISPALYWSGAPDTTRAFALVCVDPNAPGGHFYHWGLWGLPLFLDSIPEGYGSGTHLGVLVALNDFHGRGYHGPCPPHGHGAHRYHFVVYALDTADQPHDRTLTCRQIESLARRHALAMGEAIGSYAR